MGQETKEWRGLYAGLAVGPDGKDINDPTYWSGDLSFTIEKTNRELYDRPTFLCMIPAECLGIDNFSTAVADDCYRQFIPYLEDLNDELYNRHKTREQTGWYYTAHPAGEILKRNSAYFEMRCRKSYRNVGGCAIVYYRAEEVREPQMCLCMRIQVQLKKNDKKKSFRLIENIPMAIRSFIKGFDRERSRKVSELAKKQKALRAWLAGSEYVSFIANGSILPRDSKTGMALEGAVPFQAPAGEEIEACGIRGLGIKKGVTIITGGGYSGKSTVLDTISAGIYDHVLGDGRELCVTDSLAMSISAEDGRSVKALDISPFISWIPGGDPSEFRTEHASGSTSQAANILEAIHGGSRLLLIDEDRSATNFMIRDALMKDLIQREPITPFTERVNELYTSLGVSTILVIGGSGEYLAVADQVYLMDEYRIYNVTDRAKEIYTVHNNGEIKASEVPKIEDWSQDRILRTKGFTPYPKVFGPERLEIPDIGYIIIGDEKIDTNPIHDIVCHDQRTAIGFMIRRLENKHGGDLFSDPDRETIDLEAELDALYAEIEEKGLDAVYSELFPGCDRYLAFPRRLDLLAVINRMRRVEYTK